MEQNRANQEATAAEVLSMIPDFIKNGMELNEEMLDRSKELGISEAELKLGAYEYRDRVNSMYDLVGGETNYSQMMTDMKEVMSDEDKKAFNADLGGAASKYAVKGLEAEWRARMGGEAPAAKGRVEGHVSNKGSVKPYQTQDEMLKDASYVRTGRGKLDKVARAQYEKRMAVTPDNIVYGR